MLTEGVPFRCIIDKDEEVVGKGQQFDLGLRVWKATACKSLVLEDALEEGLKYQYLFNPLDTDSSPEMQLIRKIYTNIDTIRLQPEFLMERAILTTLNDDVDRLNKLATKMLFGNEERTYLGQNRTVDSDDEGTYTIEYLNTLNPLDFLLTSCN
ncbi:hypothetical protein BGZ99_009131 [Dissophora globulifera]|uniref:ATP-dependent DNA helicase n=1 Tax=Dissophora globulifera TaxID=979702 RepID=A0A9P6UNU5_9FUNG|nr:hypothetical protein BGZ99_009131 [Dissophora globulifera]